MSTEPEQREIEHAQPSPPAWSSRADLVAYARRLLGGRSDLAEDVVQEAYLRMIERDPGEGEPRHARSWLFAVVRNIVIDERRRAALTGRPVDDDVPDIMPSTPEIAERREELEGTLRAVAGLPPRERRAIILEQAGVAAPGIARHFGMSANAVHQTLFRARRRLREARAAGWAIMPLPVVQLWLRLGSAPMVESTLVGAPGSPRPGGPLVGIVLAMVAGGSGTVAVFVTSNSAAPERSSSFAAAATQRRAPTPIAADASHVRREEPRTAARDRSSGSQPRREVRLRAGSVSVARLPSVDRGISSTRAEPTGSPPRTTPDGETPRDHPYGGRGPTNEPDASDPTRGDNPGVATDDGSSTGDRSGKPGADAPTEPDPTRADEGASGTGSPEASADRPSR